MQSVRQIVLYLTRDTLPMLRIAQPAGSVGDEGPGPYFGDPRRKRIEAAVGAVLRRDMAGEPIVRNMTRAHDKTKDGDHQLRMRRRRKLTVIGDLAAVPEAGNIGLRLRRP